MNKRILFLVLFIVLGAFMLPTAIRADEPVQNSICAAYFSGIGCPHCAKTDPVLLPQSTSQYPLVIIDYEIYQSTENAPLLYEYNDVYGEGLGIPQIIFGPNASIRGDSPILDNIDAVLASADANPCPLLDGMVPLEEVDFTSLPGDPKLWANNRVLLWDGGEGDNDVIYTLVTSPNISQVLTTIPAWSDLEPQSVPISGGSIDFDYSIHYRGWIVAWNGDAPPPSPGEEGNGSGTGGNGTGQVDLTLAKLLGLAAVDAINPCALAVLTLMLIAIVTYSAKNKRNILWSGLSFTAAVFIIYLFYGLVLIKFFQLVQLLTSIRLILLTILAVAAIILGLLNIRDFFRYKPGRVGTEMPLAWRPKVKKLLSKVTGPGGAFVIGAFVTIFLLPCTIGPYVIASGILSFMDLLSTVPWLLLYNLIFVLPMVIITLIVYGGMSGVKDVANWKDKHIRYLHLIAGILMLLLGIAMLLGWV